MPRWHRFKAHQRFPCWKRGLGEPPAVNCRVGILQAADFPPLQLSGRGGDNNLRAGKNVQAPCVLSTYIPLVLSPVLPLVVGVSHPAVAVHVDVTCGQQEKDTKGSARVRRCRLARREPQTVATLHASLTDKNAPLKVGCVLKRRTRKRLLPQVGMEGSQTAHTRGGCSSYGTP